VSLLEAKPSRRILHCLRAPVGGLFRHVCDLAAEQARRGHAVGIVCDAGGNALTEAKLDALKPLLKQGLFRLSLRREIGLGDALAYRQIAKLAKSGGFDVIHGHGAKGGAYARLAGRAMARSGQAARVIYTPHGGSLHYDPRTPKGALFMAIERRLAGMTDGFIFESAYSAQKYEEQVGPVIAPKRIIPNGLLPEEFAPVEHNADAAEFLFIGELRHLKGVDVLLNALGRIGRDRMVRAVVVGAGPDAEKFQRHARQLNLQDRVTFPGAHPAREAFKMGHILIIPSRNESFPYIVLEAAAAGMPIITTNVGGIPEIVAGTDNALIPAGDVAALAVAMLQAAENPAKTKAKADRLRTRVQDLFTVAAMTDAVLALYAQSAPAA
jgi:glycosyltransferase involved in cell wall biosynthesis